MALDWMGTFEQGLPYQAFLDKFATSTQQSRWNSLHGRFSLDAGQTALLKGFTRKMPVLCLAGAWCGDCINQCPAFDHFAKASTAIDLRSSIATPCLKCVTS